MNTWHTETFDHLFRKHFSSTMVLHCGLSQMAPWVFIIAITIWPINRIIDKATINRIEISPSINRSSQVFCVNHTCVYTAMRQQTLHRVQVQRERERLSFSELAQQTSRTASVHVLQNMSFTQ